MASDFIKTYELPILLEGARGAWTFCFPYCYAQRISTWRRSQLDEFHFSALQASIRRRKASSRTGSFWARLIAEIKLKLRHPRHAAIQSFMLIEDLGHLLIAMPGHCRAGSRTRVAGGRETIFFVEASAASRLGGVRALTGTCE